MVKSSLFSTELYNTPRECIEAQLKKYKIVRCYYFFHKGASFTSIYGTPDAIRATPEEMLELAVEHFNKYGDVEFEGVNEDSAIYVIGCWDESVQP